MSVQLIRLTWRESFWYARRFLLHVLLGGRFNLWCDDSDRVFLEIYEAPRK